MTDANAYGIPSSGKDSDYHVNMPNNTQSRPIDAKTGKRIKVPNKPTNGGLSIPPSSNSSIV